MSIRGHIPLRRCLGCRSVKPQASLLRLAEGGDAGWRIDPERRLGGRGHYVCLSESCLARLLTQRTVRGMFFPSTIQQIRRMIKEQSEVEPS
ncbi:MAG: DUF448 domain-containing protein [Candidatus Latescibacteria bacterium]|nr:DUF448 domain-containing protein [Candidatus Latescibacterota bacterium]